MGQEGECGVPVEDWKAEKKGGGGASGAGGAGSVGGGVGAGWAEKR